MNDNRNFDRIVIMANDVDRLGGIGRFMNQMAIQFDDAGYEVELVGVTPPPPMERQDYARPSSILTRFLWSAAAPENWTLRTLKQRLDPFRRHRFAKRAELRAAAIEKLSDLLLDWGPRTLILCTQVYGMEHLKEAGYHPNNSHMPRVIGQYHGSFSMCQTTGDLKRIVTNYSEIEKFVCLSAADSDLFQKASLNNVTWIPNPVQPPPFEKVDRRNVFVALARYDKQKSLEYFLRAWKLIAHKYPEWSVELYGEGVLRKVLSNLIIDENIPRACLMGMAEDIGTVLSSSKIHVLSSQYEGLPIAIVEASMLGVPTIAFDCAPGIHDLISHDISGLIVPLNNITKLAAAMDRLAGDSLLLSTMSESAISGSQEYRPAVIQEKWLELIGEISR